jgi:hypothetical protein
LAKNRRKKLTINILPAFQPFFLLAQEENAEENYQKTYATRVRVVAAFQAT